MARTAPKFGALRALSDPERERILAQLEGALGDVSAGRKDRQLAIARRHIFNGESRSRLSAELGISHQQFYADRRHVLKRLATVSEAAVAPRGPLLPTAMQTRQILLAHAQALFNSGAALQAAELLQRVALERLEPAELLDAVGLCVQLQQDLYDPTVGATLLERCRTLYSDAADDSDEKRLSSAAFHWLSGETARHKADHDTYRASIDIVPRLLQPLVVAGHAAAVKAFGVFWNHLVRSYPGNPEDIETHSRHGFDVLESRNDLPIWMRAELRASQSYLYGTSPSTITVARELRQAALTYGIQNGVPRAIWMSLYLTISEGMLREDHKQVLQAALTLGDIVGSSESVEWKMAARVSLSGIYARLGMHDSAAGVYSGPLAPVPNTPRAGLEHLVLLVARAQYREAVSLANRLTQAFQELDGHLHRAKVLQLRAIALHKLGETSNAAADIRQSIEIYESLGTWLLYASRDAYRIGYIITSDPRYRDLARDLTLPGGGAQHIPKALRKPLAGLSARQREIATLAASGKTNREIADALGLSHRTVGNHLAAVFDELGIRARWQLEEALRIPRIS